MTAPEDAGLRGLPDAATEAMREIFGLGDSPKAQQVREACRQDDIERAQRTEQQIRAIVRDELALELAHRENPGATLSTREALGLLGAAGLLDIDPAGGAL